MVCVVTTQLGYCSANGPKRVKEMGIAMFKLNFIYKTGSELE
jgi:hypothetical protein